MALLDFLNPSEAEIKKRTATAMAKSGNTQELDAIMAKEQAEKNKIAQDNAMLANVAMPELGLGGNVGPAPASINTQSIEAPKKNWNLPQAQAPAATANPFQQASQIASMMPSGGLGMQASAAKDIGQAQSAGFVEQSAAQSDYEKNLKASEDRIKQIQNEKEIAQKEFDTKYDEALADLKGTEIDSERLWKNKSTGSKILTGIGLALSAFGGPEAVARSNQIIQGAIDRDIEEQKANYGVKKEGIQGMSNVYARMMDKFGDKEKAEGATRAFYNDQLQNKIAQISSKTNSKVALANADMLRGQYQSQKDGIVGQLGMSLMSSVANKGPEYDQVIPDKYTPKNEEEAKRYIPGVGLATDAESAKELRIGVEGYKNFAGGLKQLIQLREKYGSESLPSDAKALMTQIRGQLKFGMKNTENLGVLSDGDTKMIDDVIADGTSFNPSTLPRLKALQNSSLEKFGNKIKPRLMNPTESLASKLKTGQF